MCENVMNVLFMRRCYGRLIIMLQNMYILNHFRYMPLLHLYSQKRRHLIKVVFDNSVFEPVYDSVMLVCLGCTHVCERKRDVFTFPMFSSTSAMSLSCTSGFIASSYASQHRVMAVVS